MAVKKKGPTKPKARRVPSDDCILTQDGEEYAIHAGEWVEFRGRANMGFFTKYLQMQSLAESAQGGASTPGDAVALGLAAESIADQLAQHISSWTWTNDDGDPMPLPAKGEALDDLDQIEFQWLLEHFLETSDGDRPNASSPSTSA